MDEDGHPIPIYEQPRPAQQNIASNQYGSSSQNLGYHSSPIESYESDMKFLDQNPGKPFLGAYTNASGPQIYLQAPPAHSQPSCPIPSNAGSNPRNSHGIQLRPVSVLPDVYRSFFKFGVFNAIQSRCYDSLMNTPDNMVVSAPTGSGKTVLFELALIRLLMQKSSPNAKCVYMAPTKALCSERYRDWTAKLDPMGVKCCELTGDTIGFGRSAWGDAKNSSVIITTPEKFDSLSRNWYDHSDIMSRTQLFLIDEVHILNETRGATLEVVASRVKAKGNSVRFILVSATVPNIDDIAAWIGNGHSDGPATVFNFGNEFRPCKLTRVVYGYPRKGQNDFSFSRTLDYKVLPLLQKHAENKPVLVFCATRKGVIGTAEVLMKEYQKLSESKQSVPWTRPRMIDAIFHDNKLQEFANAGIGVHHAGLTIDDRRVTESLFLNKTIRVVVATSTLAVGVNLPAHTVVVKGVKMWMNGEWQEYSDLDFIQMIGRAGRPQFDKEGVAVILCDTDQERKYKALISGQTLLESSLHVNLAEHLNSEIGLNTITDLATAKEWLHNTFLFQRLQKNPPHYALGKAVDQTWQTRIDELVESSIIDLQKNKLVTANGKGGGFSSTEYGVIMSKYYIRLSTMGLILKLSEKSTMREILEMIASAEEIDLHLRAGEKQIYKKIGDNNDIRFRTKVEKPSDKIFILIQAVLGGISLSSPEYKTSDSQPYLEAISVFKHAVRIARTIVEVAIIKKSGAMLKHGMELVRSINAKAWEDRPMVLRQIEQIGEKSIKVLAENGITTFMALRKEGPGRIENLLNRRPPFGNTVLAAAREMPQLYLNLSETSVSSFRGKKPVEIELTIECGLMSTPETRGTAKGKRNKSNSLGMTGVLTLTSDDDFVDFRRIPTKALRDSKTFVVCVELTKPSQTVIARISPDNFAGLTVVETYRPSVEPGEYPTRDTRPASYDVDSLMLGLEDNSTFWDSGDFSEDEIGHKRNISSSPRSKVSDSTKAKLTTTMYKVPNSLEPVKLSNGNYQCLHTCKDKTKCRHFCCRDGLSNPPKKPPHPAPSKTSQASSSEHPSKSNHSIDRFVHVIRPEDVTKSKQKAKKLPSSESDLEHLEALHQRSGGLELPAGRRLKLQTIHPQKSNKTSWDTNIPFTDIENPAKADMIDEEDLPEPCDILSLHSLKKGSLSTELPADHSLDRNTNVPISSQPGGARNKLVSRGYKRRCSMSSQEDITATTNAQSVRISNSPSAALRQAPKRPRLQASLGDTFVKDIEESNRSKSSNLGISKLTTAPEARNVSKPNLLTKGNQRVPLFLEDLSGDEGGNNDAAMYDDEPFTFDPNTFDIESEPTFTPDAIASNPKNSNTSFEGDEAQQHKKFLGTEDRITDRNRAMLIETESAQVETVANLEKVDAGLDDYMQGLAEFEAWLQSGAVEITDGTA